MMGFRLRDSVKGYEDCIGKVIPPSQTCEVALRQLAVLDPPIYRSYFRVEKYTGVPQYRVIGTNHYRDIVPTRGSNGKGHTPDAALASGLMEFIERYSCFKYLRDPSKTVRASFQQMGGGGLSLAELYQSFVDGSRVQNLPHQEVEATMLCWHQACTLHGRKVYIPLHLMQYLNQRSNGMCAGNTLEEALLQGTCEVLERHCLSQVRCGNLSTPSIRPSSIVSKVARDLLQRLGSAGGEVLLKDFSLGLGLPVIGVVRRIDHRHCIVTAGVATTRDEALIRALTESSQYEHESNCERYEHLQHHYRPAQTVSLQDLSEIGDSNIRIELERIDERLRSLGMRIWFVETTDAQLRIPCAIVVVVGAKQFQESNAHRNILLGMIVESLANEAYSRAEEMIARGLEQDLSNHLIYLYYRGILLGRRGRFEQAVSCMEKVLAEHQTSSYRRLALAQVALCLYAQGELGAALKRITSSVTDYDAFTLRDTAFREDLWVLPDSSPVLKQARRHFAELVDYIDLSPRIQPARARLDFESHLAADPTITSCLQKIEEYLRKDEHARALDQVESLRRASPVAARIHNAPLLAGRCLVALGRFEQAVPELEDAVTIDPVDKRANLLLYDCYRALGQPQQAERELLKTLTKFEEYQLVKV